MVALVLSTIGLMTLAQLMVVTLQMQQLGRNSTNAARLAQDKVDELTTVGFANAQMACGGSLTTNAANHNDTAPTATNFRRRWTVGAGPDAALTLRTVTVRVIPDVNDRRRAMPYDLTTIVRAAVPGVLCP